MKRRIDDVDVDKASKRRLENAFRSIANVLAKSQISNAEWHKQTTERKILEDNKRLDVIATATRRRSAAVFALRWEERHSTKIDKHQQKARTHQKQHDQNEDKCRIVRNSDKNKELR